MKSGINVLMVGSSTKVKGGMTTVVESFLSHQFKDSIRLKYIATHSEKGKIYNSFFFIRSLFFIMNYILFQNPQIVHIHMSDKGSFIRKYIIFKISKLFGKKVIVHMHGGNFNQFYVSLPPSLKVKVQDLLGNSDKVIALGKNWEKNIHKIEPTANIKILMNSVPIPEFEKIEKEALEFRILFLAVLNKEKGIMDLIEASIPVIEKSVQQKKNLLFEVAGDGPLLTKAKRKVIEAGIEDFYRFYGWVGPEEKKRLLEKTDLFVLPSYFEGLPMSILEAISYGVPVISTDVGSIDEAVKEGINGSLIKPGDISMLAEKLEWYIYHPSSPGIREASRNIALTYFDEKKYFEQMEELYFDGLKPGQG